MPAFDDGNGWLVPEDPEQAPAVAYCPEETVAIWCNPQKSKQLAADEDQGWGIGSRPGGRLDLGTHSRQAYKVTRDHGFPPEQPPQPWVACAGYRPARQFRAVPTPTKNPEAPDFKFR